MAVARFNLYAQSLILIFSKEQWPYKFLELPMLVGFWIWFGYLLSFLPSYTEVRPVVSAATTPSTTTPHGWPCSSVALVPCRSPSGCWRATA